MQKWSVAGNIVLYVEFFDEQTLLIQGVFQQTLVTGHFEFDTFSDTSEGKFIKL